MKISVLETIDECRSLAQDWRDLLRPLATEANGIGISGTIEWTLSLWENHLQSAPQKVFVVHDEQRTRGIIPCHVRIVRSRGLHQRILEPITEIFSGRSGLLLDADRASADLEALFEFIFSQHREWDKFHVTLVDGSISQKIFQETCRNKGHALHIYGKSKSPYIELPECKELYFSGLSKNFRDNLKKSENRLIKSGGFDIRFYEQPAEVEDFITRILSIDRRSWKEKAGTSITTNPLQEGFYRRFLARAAANGWFLGTILSRDGTPISYAMGFVFEKIYYNEKASYDESLHSIGAGSYIYKPLIEELYRRGVRTLDFMGNCEEYKMRWTERTYSTTSYFLYNRHVRGQLLRLMDEGGSFLRKKWQTR